MEGIAWAAIIAFFAFVWWEIISLTYLRKNKKVAKKNHLEKKNKEISSTNKK